MRGLLSTRRLALSGFCVAAAVATGGAYVVFESIPTGYSCGGLLMPKSAAIEHLKRIGAPESLAQSSICSPQWIEFDRAHEVEDAAAEEEEQAEEGGQATDRPDEAIRFRALSLRDERGSIPMEGLVNAAEHAKLMRAAQPGGVAPDQISRSSWTWLGPGNVGGRSRSIVIHPTNPSIMWLGSVGGGIWKTANAGGSWKPLNDFLANLAVSTLVIDPTNPNVLYAGTGEGFFNGDAIKGAGIFKTTNGGTGWSRLASTTNANFEYVNRLSISPGATRILAATRAGIFRSLNGGGSWSATLPGTEALDVEFHPANANLAVAGGRNGHAWYSLNGGGSWTPATGLPSPTSFDGRVELAYAESNPQIVYASVDTGSSGGALYRSANGGHSYTLVNNTAQYLGDQGWYDNTVWVDPTNANRVVVGGVDLWRSINGGSTLTKISDWREWYNGRSAHADQHGIVSHPGYNGTTNRTVLVVDDGGVYRTTNILGATTTSGWQELNNNLGITQFYSAAGNPTTGEIIAGAQDNGSQFYKPTTGPQRWTLANGGDGGFSAADPTDVKVFYSEYVYLTIARSSDRGVSSQDIYSGLADAGSCAYFIAPYILDPNNANRLLAGGCHLWRTNNAKAGSPTWSQISPWLSSGYGISAIAVLKGNANVVWIAYGNGDVYKTANGTAANPTWTRVDNLGTPLPDRYVTRIALVNANSAYVTFGGFSPDNIYLTTNGGNTWTDRTGAGSTGLPAAPVRSIVVHPLHPSWIYAGTEVGVFVSQDSGLHWTVPQSGPANVSVDELFFLNNRVIVAATHGRGVFKSDTTTTSTSMEPEVQASIEPEALAE
jgi:hypothetical protein